MTNVVDYSTWHLHDANGCLNTLALFPPEVEPRYSNAKVCYRGTDTEVVGPSSKFVEAVTIISHTATAGTLDWSARPPGATHIACLYFQHRSKFCLVWVMRHQKSGAEFHWTTTDTVFGSENPTPARWMYVIPEVSDFQWRSYWHMPFPAITKVACMHNDMLFSMRRPNRHADLRHGMSDVGIQVQDYPEYGFVHPVTGGFLTREEAMAHVLKIGQIRKADFWDHDNVVCLHSEDLWPDDKEKS